MHKKIKVGVVEDQLLFREGMKAILKSWQDIELVFESSNGYSVIDKLNEAGQEVPDVLLVDYSLPTEDNTEYNGVTLTIELKAAFPDVKVIILSMHEDENFIIHAIENGAHGYLIKESDPAEVYEAISAVHYRGSYINERALLALHRKMNKKMTTKSSPGIHLTQREVEILNLICQQMTAEEIAEKLFISVKTVNGHRANLLEKTQVKNVAGLVVYAIKNNIISI